MEVGAEESRAPGSAFGEMAWRRGAHPPAQCRRGGNRRWMVAGGVEHHSPAAAFRSGAGKATPTVDLGGLVW